MPPAHLDVRRAVRDDLSDAPSGATVMVACSGGPDSMALAAAVAWVGPRLGLRAAGVTVDHGLQQGSAARARMVAATMTELGFDQVESVHVDGGSGVDGPEGNARAARYRALTAAADRVAAHAVLLGHTLDDQAETVLLGLARGSGARSLAGMPRRSGRYRRPLLGLRRVRVRAAVPDGVTVWDDPHNADPAFARSRVRSRVLPVLETELGPGVTEALGRTADLLRADADALEAQAAAALRESMVVEAAPPERVGSGPDPNQGYDVDRLARLPAAVRLRVLRLAAIAAGSRPSDLTAAHVLAVDALVTDWRGQAGIDVPGGRRAVRRNGVLMFASPR